MQILKLFPCLFVSLIPISSHGETTPNLSSLRLYKPAFQLKDGSQFEAGTAFAVKWQDQSFTVTAHHLFGKAGGLKDELAPEQVEERFKKVLLRNVINGGEIANDKYCKIEGAVTTNSEDGALKDIAIFQNQPSEGGLTLSAASPQRGDTVWLLAKLKDPANAKIPHIATILFATKNSTYYWYHDPGIDLRATSGAPVVDKEGNVVSIHVAGIVIPYLLKIGIGSPVTFLHDQIVKCSQANLR